MLSSPLPIPRGTSESYVQILVLTSKKTAAGDSSRTFVEMVNSSRYHRLRYWKSLQLYDSPISGEIGEDLAFYLTESQQTPSAVGSMSFWTRKTRSRLQVVFPSSSLARSQGEEEIARFEKRIQKCQLSQAFSKVKTISKPSSSYLR